MNAAAAIAIDALAAAALLAVDPVGIGGVRLRGRPGPDRDRWLATLRSLLPAGAPVLRLPPGLDDAGLLGGLDLAATLARGKPVASRGLCAAADGGILVVPSAERLAAERAAQLAAVLDARTARVERDGLTVETPARFAVVLLDEGIGDETPPAAVLDRAGLMVDLEAASVAAAAPSSAAVRAARGCLASVRVSEEGLEALTAAALALGLGSLRAPLQAVRAARALAALAGRRVASEADLAEACRLVLAPRATCVPAPPAETENAEPPPAPDEGNEKPADEAGGALQDRIIAAAAAAVPPGLLAMIAAGAASRRGGAQAGRSPQAERAKTGGRPAGTRRGRLDGAARIAVVPTLRAAAPWQRIRRAEQGAPSERGWSERPRILVKRDDVRVERRLRRTQTTTIFVVDASGSAALHRLAEAKGAVEHVLGACYVRRDQVALIAFRGRGAELLLPPTRALARARRSLAALPGGGGTPLAAGIDAAAALGAGLSRRGGRPVAVFLTDGQGNVARNGERGRAAGSADALAAATAFRLAGLPALVLDTAPRPQEQACRLAETMHARYVPLPQPGAAGAAVLAAVASG